MEQRRGVQPHKLVIIGAGHVGEAILTGAVQGGHFGEIAVINRNADRAHGTALDLVQAAAMPSLGNCRVYAAGYETCEDADIIVNSAGPSVSPEQAKDPTIRRTLAKKNADIGRSLMSEIVKYTKRAIIIHASNPQDVIVHVTAKEWDYPAGLLFGTGTMIDTARMCRIIGDRCGVDPRWVRGAMLGEHGATGFPYVSGINVAGVGAEGLEELFGIEPIEMDQLQAEVNQAGGSVLMNKGWTSSAIAQAVLTLISAVIRDEKAVLPVSIPLDGEYGYRDVSLSLPCIIGAQGVERVLEVPLSGQELEKLEETVRSIKETIERAYEN